MAAIFDISYRDMPAGDPDPLSLVRSAAEPGSSSLQALHQRVTSLYKSHRDGIYRFLIAQGVPPAEAQEVAQDVFVKLFVMLREGNPILSEQGWLYGVAAKAAVDRWRREGRPIWIELTTGSGIAETLQSADLSPEALAARAEQLRRVAAAMAALPKEQRLCIQLRSQGLRYREIAKILGVGISTAAEWVSTAVKRVRGVVHD
jgi:RNA polymerase sigma-70 factor, ECF subfamily